MCLPASFLALRKERDLGVGASGLLGGSHLCLFRADLRGDTFLLGVSILGGLLGVRSTSMPVWVPVCVILRFGVCVNHERDVFGGSGCCTLACCTAGVVATSTVCMLASHVLFLGGHDISLLLGVLGWFCCSVLVRDGRLMREVGSVTLNEFLSLCLMFSQISRTPRKLGCSPSFARCPTGSW